MKSFWFREYNRIDLVLVHFQVEILGATNELDIERFGGLGREFCLNFACLIVASCLRDHLYPKNMPSRSSWNRVDETTLHGLDQSQSLLDGPSKFLFVSQLAIYPYEQIRRDEAVYSTDLDRGGLCGSDATKNKESEKQCEAGHAKLSLPGQAPSEIGPSDSPQHCPQLQDSLYRTGRPRPIRSQEGPLC